MTGSLMGFPQTSIGTVGNTDMGFVYEGYFGNLYGAASSPAGLRKWDAWPNGVELRARNTADIGTTNIYLGSTVCLRTNELVINSGASNSAMLTGFSLWDLSATSSFGIISASLAPSSNTRILASGDLCCFKDAIGAPIILCNTIVVSNELNQVGWGTKKNTRTTITEGRAVLGAVPDGSASEAWAIGTGSNSFSLYRVVAGSNILVGSSGWGPSFIDATWSNVTRVVGISIDQTDMCPIAGFETTDSVTNKAYLVKFNRTTGAVVWKVAVGTGVHYRSPDMPKNVIKNGRLYYLKNTNDTLYTINTITGAATTQTFSSYFLPVLNGHQMSEDVSTVSPGGVLTGSGSVMWYGDWSESATHPNYLGNYCLTLGNHSGSNMGWRYWPDGTPTPSPTYALAASSRKRAWTFVLDGHTFYVLDLGGQGTWVYDKSTGQWAQFITDGYAQWNFANGVMWGQRIVAGDMLTTDMWEMTPAALFDNGAHEITHVVTGGVITRSRVYHSVDSFVLACSPGYLQDGGAAASVTLSFSDDQGRTWTDMDTKTLTAADYGAETAWLSLGSFAAPGRIFKITDIGGFMRIDGADAGIDGFDPATADPGG